MIVLYKVVYVRRKGMIKLLGFTRIRVEHYRLGCSGLHLYYTRNTVTMISNVHYPVGYTFLKGMHYVLHYVVKIVNNAYVYVCSNIYTVHTGTVSRVG